MVHWIYKITLIIIILFILIYGIFKKNKIKLNDQKQSQIYLFIGIWMSLIGLSYLSFYIYVFSPIHLMFGDLCMILGIITGPIFLMKNKLFIKLISPWMFYGGLMTLALSNPPFIEENIIAGTISYLKHVSLLIFGIIGLLFSQKYTKKEIWYTLGLSLAYSFFILLTSGVTMIITGEDKYGSLSTALLKPSYDKIEIISGNYKFIAKDYQIMKHFGLYPIPSLIFYSFSWTLIYGFLKIIPQRSHILFVKL